jgi:aldehyde:ferredoxin oxidoreductase
MLGGYMGKLLRVDLTRRRIRDERVPESVLRAYIGGSGLGARLLFDGTTRECDPLGADNLLMILTGPLTGLPIPTSGRHAVVAKSPLGIWGEADCGGTLGHEMKRAGVDGVVFEGQADAPVYLLIEDGTATLEDGRNVWGKDTFETQDLLRARHGERTAVACIGLAGERLSPIAGVMNDGPHARAAGRCGLGAVMGAKRLKALAVRGSGHVPVAMPDKLKPLVKEITPRIQERTKAMRDYGTPGGVLGAAAIGDMPIQNWRMALSGCERVKPPAASG